MKFKYSLYITAYHRKGLPERRLRLHTNNIKKCLALIQKVRDRQNKGVRYWEYAHIFESLPNYQTKDLFFIKIM